MASFAILGDDDHVDHVTQSHQITSSGGTTIWKAGPASEKDPHFYLEIHETEYCTVFAARQRGSFYRAVFVIVSGSDERTDANAFGSS